LTASTSIIGWERVLSELGAKTIDKDEDPMIGELVEVTIPDVGKEKFLRVLCGTGRDWYFPEEAEAIMGFPIGWTELGHAEMPLSRKSRNSSVKP
jgi:hypothetical protein